MSWIQCCWRSLILYLFESRIHIGPIGSDEIRHCTLRLVHCPDVTSLRIQCHEVCASCFLVWSMYVCFLCCRNRRGKKSCMQENTSLLEHRSVAWDRNYAIYTWRNVLWSLFQQIPATGTPGTQRYIKNIFSLQRALGIHAAIILARGKVTMIITWKKTVLSGFKRQTAPDRSIYDKCMYDTSLEGVRHGTPFGKARGWLCHSAIRYRWAKMALSNRRYFFATEMYGVLYCSEMKLPVLDGIREL